MNLKTIKFIFSICCLSWCWSGCASLPIKDHLGIQRTGILKLKTDRKIVSGSIELVILNGQLSMQLADSLHQELLSACITEDTVTCFLKNYKCQYSIHNWLEKFKWIAGYSLDFKMITELLKLEAEEGKIETVCIKNNENQTLSFSSRNVLDNYPGELIVRNSEPFFECRIKWLKIDALNESSRKICQSDYAFDECQKDLLEKLRELL